MTRAMFPLVFLALTANAFAHPVEDRPKLAPTIAQLGAAMTAAGEAIASIPADPANAEAAAAA